MLDWENSGECDLQVKIVVARHPLSEHYLRTFRLEMELMKLELDLLRDVLLYVEKHADRPHSNIDLIEIPGWSDEQVAYHVVIASEGGLLKATVSNDPDEDDESIEHVSHQVHRLTFEGHEFLNTVREKKAWDHIKAGLVEAGVFTIRASIDLAKEYAKKAITDYMGISG